MCSPTIYEQPIVMYCPPSGKETGDLESTEQKTMHETKVKTTACLSWENERTPWYRLGPPILTPITKLVDRTTVSTETAKVEVHLYNEKHCRISPKL